MEVPGQQTQSRRHRLTRTMGQTQTKVHKIQGESRNETKSITTTSTIKTQRK